MRKKITVLIVIMVIIGLVSGTLAYLRAENISSPVDIQNKGLELVRLERVGLYGLFLPVLVGIISFFTYRAVAERWPNSADITFLFLAIAVAILLTVLAAMFFRMQGFVEVTFLHILYVVGFGWLMPKFAAP